MGVQLNVEAKYGLDSGNHELFWSKNNKQLVDNNFELTRREIEVLFFVSEGLSNVEISEILKISPHTVKDHVINIFNKMGVNNRTLASVMAVRYKII